MRIDKRMLDDIPAWLERQNDIPGGWLYIGDEKERYLLGQPGRRNMLVFGVNPSTASAGENYLDPTIKRVRKFVQKDPTCDGWIMANLYPLRATNPDDLPAKADKKLIEKNLRVLDALQKSYFIDKVWAAWGDLIDSRDYLGNTLFDIPNESIIDSMPPELPDLEQIILVYCRSGRRSKEAAQKLFDMGYINVFEFGGIIDWTGEVITEEAKETAMTLSIDGKEMPEGTSISMRLLKSCFMKVLECPEQCVDFGESAVQ